MEKLNNRKISLFTCLFFIGALINIQAQTGNYKVDIEKSSIDFKVSNIGAFKVKGTFSGFSGLFVIENSELISLNGTIKVESIDTNNDKRDDDLRDEGHFNVRGYPLMTFNATNFLIDEGSKIIIGFLKIKDTEKEISFIYDLSFSEDLNQVTLMASTRIKRKDFNLIFDRMNGLIGNKVDIDLLIVASQ